MKRWIPDLGPADFIVTEDGEEQKVTLVEQSENQPISMQSKIQTATSAIDQFLRSLLPDDDIFLMTFAAQRSSS